MAKDEEKELEFLSKYLPEEMSREEIKKIILEKKEDLEIEDKSKMGMLIGIVMRDLEGKADGATVKEIVTEILS